MTNNVKPERVLILEDGIRVTHGERDGTYGPPNMQMTCAADLKRLFWNHAGYRRDFSLGEQEALDMAITKLSRIATGPVVHRDNYVDAATYIAIAGELALASAVVPNNDDVSDSDDIPF